MAGIIEQDFTHWCKPVPLNDDYPDKFDLKCITSIEELNTILNSYKKEDGTYPMMGFDTETTGLDVFNDRLLGLSFSWKETEGYYIPVNETNKNELLSTLKPIFENPNTKKIGQNMKFDLMVLAVNGIALKGELCDCMIAHYLLQPELKHGMDYLAEVYLGYQTIHYEDLVGGKGKKQLTLQEVPLEKVCDYAAEDADFTYQLWEKFNPKIKDSEETQKLFAMEMNLLPVLAEMEITGIHLNSAALEQYNIELTRGIEDAEQEIYKEAGHEFNIASPKQLQTVLFEERKLKPGKKTKTGYSTDTSVLEELAMYDVIPKMILEYREMAKLQSTYVETLPKLCDANGRIHTDFVQTGTATGRLSCREPNLQNIPVRNEAGRRIRSAFTAPDGKVLISADYAQIELVVLAHLSGDKNMCKAFTEGTDVHRSTAALIYGVQPEAVTPEMRRTAKTINFGVIYGMSAFRLAQDLGIRRMEAEQFIQNYDKFYSDISRFKAESVHPKHCASSTTSMYGIAGHSGGHLLR